MGTEPSLHGTVDPGVSIIKTCPLWKGQGHKNTSHYKKSPPVWSLSLSVNSTQPKSDDDKGSCGIQLCLRECGFLSFQPVFLSSLWHMRSQCVGPVHIRLPGPRMQTPVTGDSGNHSRPAVRDSGDPCKRLLLPSEPDSKVNTQKSFSLDQNMLYNISTISCAPNRPRSMTLTYQPLNSYELSKITNMEVRSRPCHLYINLTI